MRSMTALLLVALLAAPAAAQEAERGTTRVWSARVPAGAWLRVLNVRGSISVREAAGDVAEVSAEVRGSSRGEIVFDTLRAGSDVTLCALWEGESECSEDGVEVDRGRNDSRRPSAHFTVSLPKGVRLVAATRNGDVEVENAGAEVDASSGNGDVRVATAAGRVFASSGNGEVSVLDAGGPVRASSGNGRVSVTTATGPVSASSGNGNVVVRMARLGTAADMEFSSGNGRVSVTLPGSFEGELDANTGNGSVQTDFPVTITGALRPNRLRGTIGKGGPTLKLSSGNGSIEVRKL
jgi:hypothetical protein